MSMDASGGCDLVVDASIGVKWFVEESHSAEASMLMVPDVRLHVPTLFFTEVAQTLWKKVHQRHEISIADGREIFERLLRLPLIRHPADLLFESSFEIALQTGRTVYDSVYLALASMNGWRFVTADERLFNALHGGPFERFLLRVGDVPSLFPAERAVVGEEWDDFEIPSFVIDQSIEEIELSVGFYTRGRLGDEHLMKSIGLEVEFLDLADSRVTDAGLVHLHEYPKLRNVNLKGTRITDSGMISLGKLTHLDTLNISETVISDLGLIHLQALDNLRSLDLAGTLVTREGVSELRRSLPNLKIIHEADDTVSSPKKPRGYPEM